MLDSIVLCGIKDVSAVHSRTKVILVDKIVYFAVI